MLKTIIVILLLAIFAAPVFAVNGTDENVITKIEITGNRIDEAIIRKNLAFKEGDTFDEAKIEKSRANLYALGLFKSLQISKLKDEISGGIKIEIGARDGWYLLPVPMFGSRGGERYFGGALLEQNALKYGERASLTASFQDSISHYALSTEVNKLTLSGSIDRRSYTEYQFQNGSYSSPIIDDDEISALAKYGQIVNSYDKDETVLRLSAGMPLADKFRGTAGISFNDIQYSDALVSSPGDTGRINALNLGVRYGKSDPARNAAGIVGRIFGLGMADLQENFKPLPRITMDYGCQAAVDTAFTALGSDAQFTKVSLSASRAINYVDRSRLSVSMKTGYGVNLPFSQLFVTDRSGGMEGVYAREFRGDQIITGNISYRRSFYRNRRGQLVGELFCEYGECFFKGRQGAKEGAGCNLTYQFWRFPLPLGFGYTYSIDDNDWKVSAGFGGLF